MKYFPSLTIDQIHSKSNHLKTSIQANKHHPDSHIKKIIESPVYCWSKEEEATFVELIKKHGKNYKLISATIPSKDVQQIRMHCCKLYKKLEKNPRHIHRALKKKLTPLFKPVSWTTKELKVLLRGLKKNVKCWDWMKRTVVLFNERNF